MSKEGNKPTSVKKEIEALKDKIRELFPAYQTRRLELSLTLYKLREMTAHHKTGNFTDIAVNELGIPRSTVYDLLDYAESELKRLEKELSKNRTKSSDDTVMDIDMTDPEAVAEFLKIAYPEGVPPKQKRKPTPYLNAKGSTLMLLLDQETRLEVAAAWKLIKTNKKAEKRLCYKLAKEIINAAAKITTSPDKRSRRTLTRHR